jgi:putative FmdB family regulatory protein
MVGGIERTQNLRNRESTRYGAGDCPMPIYEFQCPSCGKRFSDLLPLGTSVGVCTFCGAKSDEKRVSRIQRARSESDRLDEISDQLEGMGEADESAMEGVVREMGKALDEDFSEDLSEAFERGDFDAD